MTTPKLIILYHKIHKKNMNRTSQLDLFQSFIEREEQRSKVAIGGQSQAIFDYCEYVIHTEYDKKSKVKYKFKERKKQVSEQFMRAYSTLEKQDKVTYYIKNVIYLIRISTNNLKVPKIREGTMETIAYTLSYTIRRWKEKKMRLDNNRQVIFGQKNGVIKEYDLGNYIFRGSKNNKYYTFVLEAIRDTVHPKARTVHIGFENAEVMKEWADAVQLCIDFKHWQRLYIEINKKPPSKQILLGNNKASVWPTKKPAQNQPQQQKQKPTSKQSMVLIEPPAKFEQSPQRQIPSSMPVDNLNKSFLNPDSSGSQKFMSDSGQQEQGIQPIDKLDRTIIEDLVQGQAAGIQNIETIQNRNAFQKNSGKIKNLNIFHKMFPEFEFNQVEIDNNYEMIQNDKGFRILQHNQEKQRFKIFMEFPQDTAPAQYVFKSLCGPEFTKTYNQNVQQSQVKTFISSENAAIMYLVLKPFNRIYRPRDFVFIRHCFKVGPNAYYIADKDIQNSNFPPFITIVRGRYECIWTVLNKENGVVKLVGNIFIDNSGYLNDMQNTNLTLNYLRNFSKLGAFVADNNARLSGFGMFDIAWDITKNSENQKDNQIRLIHKKQKVKMQKQKKQLPKSQSTAKLALTNLRQTCELETLKIEQRVNQNKQMAISSSPRSKLAQKQKQLDMQRQKMNMEQVQGQIDPKDVNNSKLQTITNVKLNFDTNGMVIISKTFIKNKYQLVPVKDYPLILMESSVPGKHPLWTDDWKHDVKKGGLLFINAKKIQDQKGVLKFILSKIGKNLLSGKSILNISLPVDIFVAKSNLELFILSLCYGPILLERAVLKNPFDKFKTCVAFGISMSSLYLLMQKPFNPILGQTFQAWINGCPAYAEQISHHPPICSLLLYGRGYTISGQFQSKAEVHMNSGTGTNDGIFKINFDDGNKIRFCSAGGQVSGLTYGDRKFNIQGKAYCWSEPSNYFTEIVFNPTKKGFFSMKKQEQPEDYYQGQTFKVTPQFISSLYVKRRAPTQKQIIETLGKFNGVWHQQMFYEQQSFLNIGNQLPVKLEYEKNPLPSDANWRQDIAYRRLMQVPRAQVEKQRLQNLQRSDRKLREKKK